MAGKYTFDPDALTGELMEDFAEHVGAELFSFMGENGELDRRNLTGKAMSGVMWVAMRMSGRDDVTWEEARRTPFAELADAEKAEPDPTNGDGAS